MKPGRRTMLLARPSSWPLTVRVPAVVVLLMLMVSAVISERVLSRLIENQSRHLTELTGAYLDGVSSAVLPQVLREDVWEIYDALDRATRQYQGLDVVWTTVVDSNGIIIASSKPREHVTQEQLPDQLRQPESPRSGISMDETRGLSQFRRKLVHQGREVGAIHGEVRIEALIAERWSVLFTLILTNAALTIALAIIGYWMIRRMVRPVGLLSNHMQVDVDSDFKYIPQQLLGRPSSEFGRLFRRYNSLVDTVRERERLLQRLAQEERLAALGRLSSVMAHEINNPLGGMLNAVQTLKRYGHQPDVRDSSVNLIERGLLGIRNVVCSTLATYRSNPDQQLLTAEHLEDLAVLIQPEIRHRGLKLHWENSLDQVMNLPAQPIRDAALNLLLNACAASPRGGTIEFEARAADNVLMIRIGDQGRGLPEDRRRFLEAGLPDLMPVAGQGGFGLWIVRRIMSDLDGSIEVLRHPERGTQIRLNVPLCKMGGSAPFADLKHVTVPIAQEHHDVAGRSIDRSNRGRSDHGREPMADA